MTNLSFATLALLATCMVTSAQEFRGSILGRISDPSGAVLPGAAVSAVNEETNVKIDTKSNEEGNYLIPFLLPGRYTVRVESDGFKAALRPGITVQINDRIEVNFALEIGSTTEAITVTAETPLLQTATADMGQVVERQMLDRLPMTNMNAMNLADMAPGVLGGSGNTLSNGQNEITINGGGGIARGNDITIDGIPNVAPRFNGLAVTIPSPDAVQEFKVATTMFDAQNGRSNGGTIAFTTRSGTNNFHGTAYYFFYDEHLNANGWQRNRNGQARAPITEYRTGGTFGGPVRLPKLFGLPGYDGRNKTFFFFAYEKSRNENEFTRFARVPTELERQGDFSQTLSLSNTPLVVYDPLTTQIDGTRTIRQPFTGNRIPANRIDPTGAAVMNLFDKPNQAVAPRIGTLNWMGTGTFKGSVNNLSSRLDQVISDKQRLYLRFSQVDGLDTRDPYAMKGAYELNTNASSRTNDNINPRTNRSAAVDNSYSFSPSIFGSFRYGYTRTHLYDYFDGNTRDPREQKLPDVVLANQVTKGYALIRLNENLPHFGSRARTSVNDTHSLYVTMNQLKGRHTIKYGLDTRVIRWNENNPGETQNGDFYFDTRFTRADPTTTPSIQTSGTSMASLLLGLPYDSRIGYTSALSLQSWYTGLFVQDDLKVNRRLTLNLGLRWELETPQTERFDRIGYGFDPQADIPLTVPGMDLKGAIQFVNVDGRGRRNGLTDYNNFGPRLGFAYTLTERTVLRGGYGIFYASGIANISGTSSVNSSALGGLPAFNAISRMPSGNSSDGGRTYITTLQNPWPFGLTMPTGSSLGPLTEIGNSITVVNPDRLLPYTQQWQFSVQRLIGWNTTVDAGYVGSHALKLYNNFNWNERADEWLKQGTGESDRIPNPFYGIFPPTSTLGGTSTTTQGRLWVTFPQFQNVQIYGMNTDRSLYHSGQLAIRKRMSNGLSLNVNYTYSKNMVYDGASLINERHWRSVASTDRPHIFRIFATYLMPFGRGKAYFSDMPKWADAVVGGWEFGGAFRMTSGTPLSISQARGRPIPIAPAALSGAVRDRLGDRIDPVTGRPQNPYFRTDVWEPLASDFVISLEPLRYSWLRGPRGTYTALTGYKVFRLAEGYRFEVRAEANNALNHPIFSNPATNMDNPATFGTITGAGGVRTVNISGKIIF